MFILDYLRFWYRRHLRVERLVRIPGEAHFVRLRVAGRAAYLGRIYQHVGLLVHVRVLDQDSSRLLAYDSGKDAARR